MVGKWQIRPGCLNGWRQWYCESPLRVAIVPTKISGCKPVLVFCTFWSVLIQCSILLESVVVFNCYPLTFSIALPAQALYAMNDWPCYRPSDLSGFPISCFKIDSKNDALDGSIQSLLSSSYTLYCLQVSHSNFVVHYLFCFHYFLTRKLKIDLLGSSRV